MTRLIPRLLSVGLTVLFLLGGAVALVVIWQHYEEDPWTRDGTVQADVVQVSADVSGLVTQVHVHDNQRVTTGDVLFMVDQERYAAALDQARASVASAQAAIVSAQADIAKSKAMLGNALREQARYLSLGNLVSKEDRDQRVTTVEQDRAQLAQSEASLGDKEASLKEAQANQRKAEIDLERSSVRAGVTGYVTNFSMRPGDYVSSGNAQFALLDTASYYVLAYMEETKLHRFSLGDRARIELLGDDRPLWGHVDSLSAGITDRQKDPTNQLLPNITPTFSWIRLAQRVPVRVVIDTVPEGIRLVAGRTATVNILPTVDPVGNRQVPPSSEIVPNTAPQSQTPPSIGKPSAVFKP